MLKISFAFMLALVVVSCDITQESSEMGADEKLIREVRSASNNAIEKHDTLQIADALMDNYILLTSTDMKVEGKEESRKLFVQHFRERPDVSYVRTPTNIEVFRAWGMASEMGTWEGGWSEQEDKIKIGGTYYAKWHRVDDKWLLRSEIFTPTYCVGGAYCDR